MKPANLETIWPLSPLQEGLLFHSLQEPGTGLYVEQATCTLEGTIDPESLRCAWQAVLDSTPALRAGFLWRDLKRPVQPVNKHLSLPWVEEDWRQISPEHRKDRFEKLMAADRKRGFDPSKPPLLRFHLLRTDDYRYRFLWTFHHLLLDGWSVFQVLEEVLACAALKTVSGTAQRTASGGSSCGVFPTPTPRPRRRPFGDYLAWLKGQDGGEEAFWTEYLAPFTARTSLPTLSNLEVRGPAAPNRELEHVLSKQESEALKGLARRSGTTLNTILEAAWAWVLARTNGTNKALFGSVVSGRPPSLPGAERMIGLFLNTVPVAVTLNPGEKVGPWLRRLHREAGRRRRFEHSPLPQVRRWSALPPGGEMFQSLLAFESYPRDSGILNGGPETPWKIQGLEVKENTHYPITLVVLPEACLEIYLEYRPSTLSSRDAQRLLSRLLKALRCLPRSRGRQLASLGLATPLESHQILHEWPLSAGPAATIRNSRDRFLQRVAERCRHSPHAAAVEDESRIVTYGELWQIALATAGRLRQHGLRLGQVVALTVTPSALGAAAWLGILWSHGTVFPLDPALPRRRRDHLLRESGAKLMVVDDGALAESPGDGDPKRFSLSDLTDPTGTAPANVTSPPQSGAAYLLFTSGSTGAPKGVVVPHGGLDQLVSVVAHRYGLETTERVLQFASWSFDVAMEELFATWWAGATAVLCPPQARSSWSHFRAFLERRQITLANLPASFWHGWVRALEESSQSPPEGLRLTVVGNEAVLPEVFSLWQRRARRDQELLCAYGPTEGTVTALCHRPQCPEPQCPEPQCPEPQCPEPEPPGFSALPLGRPLAGVGSRILDEQLYPVLPGASGLLALEGAGLAQCYWRNPRETALRFVPNPFATTPRERHGDRLYLTGDRARWRADGVVEFLGRQDRQIQLRGFRIELGEVEGVLSAHPKVTGVAVQVQGETSSETAPHLVAYLESPIESSGESSAEFSGAELQAWAAQRLPPYMVPAAFVILEHLPRLSSGKVDTAALVPPTGVPTASDQDRPQEPLTARESSLAAIWQQVLGVASVGPQDDFFALGGDSISSLQIADRARAMGLEIPPAVLLEKRSLARVAAAAKSLSAPPVGSLDTDQGPQADSGELPLTPLQHWYLEGSPSTPHHWNQAFFLETPGNLSPLYLERALHDLVKQHDALRLRFHRKTGGVWVQEVAEKAPPPIFAFLDFHALDEVDRLRRLQREAASAQTRLDLESGQLVAAFLATSPRGRRGRLFLAIHHLAVDAFSWGPLLTDLATAYEARAAGQAPIFPSASTPFSQWARRLESFALSASGDLWLQQETKRFLAPPPAADFPLDRSGKNLVGSVGQVEVELPPQTGRSLLALDGNRAQEVLLAALVLALGPSSSRKSGHNSSTNGLRVDVEGHGRLPPFKGIDLSRTVGCFTTIYPVTLDLSQGKDPTLAMAAVRRSLEATSPGALAFGVGQCFGNPELRDALKHLPPASVSFNFLGRMKPGGSQFRLAREDPGLTEGAENQRRHILDLNVYARGEALVGSWAFSHALHDVGTVEGWTRAWTHWVERLVSGLLRHRGPVDFPLAGLDRQSWDDLLARLPAGEEAPWEDLFPLTPLQQGLVFHSTLEPEAARYHSQMSCDISGPLEPQRFRAAWQHLVDRHGVLRTALLPRSGGEPLQAVFRHAEAAGTVLDWCRLPVSRSKKLWSDIVKEDSRRGLPLEKPPLLRWILARLGSGDFRLLISHHHLLLDGWSNSLLLAELLTTYSSLRRGEKPAPEDPRLASPASFRDYVGWLASQSSRSQWWRNTLGDFAAPTPLPLDRPRPADGGSEKHPAEIRRRLAAQSFERVRELGQRRGLTSSRLTQATWGLLLSRWADVEDVVFGITLAGRTARLPEMERRLGLFIHTLPLRLSIRRHQTLGHWLEELRRQQGTLLELPPISLVELHRFSRLAAGVPLFETLVVFENYPVTQALEGEVEELSFLNPASLDRTHLPLSLAVLPKRESNQGDERQGQGQEQEQGQGLELILGYEGSLFDTTTAHRLLDQFTRLLLALTSDDKSRLEALSPLSLAERHQLLVAWPQGPAAGADPSTLAQVLQRSVRKYHDRVALTAGATNLTYSELWAGSKALAEELRRRGAGPDLPIAIHLDRSPELILALVAVVRAGAAYLALDTTLPQLRLARLLKGTLQGISQPLLIARETAQPLVDEVASLGLKTLSRLDPTGPKADPTKQPLLPSTDPRNLAYILYTSGSTDLPKGVAISQGALVNHTHWWTRAFQVTREDVLLQRIPLSFDPSGLEIWGALAAGARLVLPPQGTENDPALMLRLLRDQGITLLLGSPSWLHLLTQAATEAPPGGTAGPVRSSAPPTSLRWVISGGEVLPQGLVEPLEQWSGARVANLYGPTEAAITATYQPNTDAHDNPRVAIGKPIQGLRALVLDRHGEPCPRGAVGELFLGGLGLARGYWRQPALTARCFLPDSTQDAPGQRLYRTGDLARWDTAGNLHILGRRDSQIKVRGVRVEPEEIEAALTRHPAVRQAAVLVGDDATYLQAHVVLHQPAPSRELRRFLLQQLPATMVPDRFLPREALPLTTTGKVDRRALLTLEGSSEAAKTSYKAPRSPFELQLVAIWERLLAVERIGIEDDFFELGGNSLIALRLITELRLRLAWELPLEEIFHRSTVADLAEMAEGLQDSGLQRPWPAIVPFEREGDATPMAWVHPGNGSAMGFADLANALKKTRPPGKNRPLVAFQAPGLLPGQDLPATVEDLAELYLEQLREYRPEGPWILAGWSFGGLVAYEMARRSALAGDPPEGLVIADMGPAQLVGSKEAPGPEDSSALSSALEMSHEESDHWRQLTNPQERLDWLSALAEKKQLAAPGAGRETVSRWASVAASLEAAAIAYRPGNYSEDLLLLRPRSDSENDLAPDLGWGRLVAGKIEIRLTPGTHHTLLQTPNVEVLAAWLEPWLESRRAERR
ncbi:MAG: amino acid adenylation domain-containing protein [Deltaproteobacteria bacterium]|nr:amino acid adenylation domain-containing protein [Deltaproteobacteria bacterium]